MNFSKYILSYERRDQDRFLPIPYVLQFKKGKQVLLAVGFRHSADPENPDFLALEKLLDDFSKQVTMTDAIGLRENRYAVPKQTIGAAIKNNGEAGVLTYLAHQAGMLVTCPEPDPKSERDHLLKRFTKDEIQLLWLARDVVSWQRYYMTGPFEVFQEKMMRHYARESGWTDFDFTFEHMKKVYEQTIGSPFTTDFESMKELDNPAVERTVVNEVARASSRFRDEHIVGEIAKYWSEGKSIFVVYGRTHVIMWEPALQAIIHQ